MSATIPHDAQAEAGALACVLTANGEAADLLEQLSEADFHDIRHRTIFRALASLQSDSQPLNTVSLAQRLKDNGSIEDAGGFDYVCALPDQTPSPENFPVYLETVNDRAARREVVRQANMMHQAALDTTKPVQTGRAKVQTMLAEREFNADIEPPPLRAIYELQGVPICTPGNLTAITAAAKAGKTAALGAMVASALPHNFDADLLGFQSSNPQKRAVLWFDSEQSKEDHWHCVNRALKRAGLSKPPPWLHAYYLTGSGAKQGWEAVRRGIKDAVERHGGIHSIFLDGVADFVADVNDSEESNSFVAELHAIAIELDCPIIGVLHLNPNSDTKSRGHLGSQLERKAETNLMLKKDTDGSSVVYSTKNRRAGIPEDKGPRFKYSQEAGMHVSFESRQSAKDTEKRESLADLARDVFNGRQSMRYAEIVTGLATVMTVKQRQAERKVAEMKLLTVIKPSVAGLYVLADKTE